MPDPLGGLVDDNGEIIRQTRTPGGGTTGGGGVGGPAGGFGGGGGAGGFSGFSGYSPNATPSGGMGRRTLRGGFVLPPTTDAPNGSTPLPLNFRGGGPVRDFRPGGHVRGPGTATSDSIRANLSNGEYVEPAHIAQHPMIHAFLEALRMGHPAALHAIHLCMGGPVRRGYASGGAVRMPAGVAGGDGASAAGPDYSSHPSDPWQDQGFATQFAGQHFGGGTGAGSLADAYDKYLHSAAGIAAYSSGGAHGAFDPNDPWASFSGDQRGGWDGSLNREIGAGGAAGAYDPMGSSSITGMLRQSALQDADALTARSANQGKLLGLDPSQQASYAMDAGLTNAGHVGDALNQATLQQALSGQDFARSLYSGYLGSNYGMQGQRLAADLRPKQGSGWGQVAGSVLGAGIGALAGPGGAAAGYKMGGGLGGGFDTQSDPNYYG